MNKSASSHSRCHTRLGSVYLVTLITVAAIASMVMLGVTLRSATSSKSALVVEMSKTNTDILNATELTLQSVYSDPSWMKTAQSGVALPKQTINGVVYGSTVKDADTDTTPTDTTINYQLTMSATKDSIEHVAQVTLKYGSVDYTSYLTSLTAMFYWPLNEDPGASRATENIQSQRGTYFSPSAAGFGSNDEGAQVPVFKNSNSIVGVDWNNDYAQNNGSIAMWIKYTGPEKSSTPSPFVGLNYKYGGHPTLNLAVFENGIHALVNNEGTWDNWYAVTSSSGTIKPDTWHHITLTWGASGLALYIDGVQSAYSSRNKYGVATAGILYGGYQPLYIGGGYNLFDSGTPYVGFTGSVAHVAYFDAYLTSDQVAELAAMKPDGTALSLKEDSWVLLYGE